MAAPLPLSALARIRCYPNSALWLVALALFIKALLPAGTMLAPAQDGFVRIVVCTAQGLVTRTLDAEGHSIADVADTQAATTNSALPNSEQKTPEPNNHLGPCLFQVLGFALLGLVLLFVWQWPARTRSLTEHRRTVFIKIRSGLLPPSRAPPLHTPAHKTAAYRA